MGIRGVLVGAGLAITSMLVLAGESPHERFIVRYAPDAEHAVAAAMISERGRIHRRLPAHRLLAASLPESALTALRNRSDVELVEVDPRRFLQAQQTPYGITLIGAGPGGLAAVGGHSRKVCIMDTGYDLGHVDLPADGALVGGDDGYPQGCGGADCDTGLWSEDGHGHGTHVSGTIVALDNSEGVVGIHSNGTLPIHMVKVFNDQGNWAYGSDLIAAIGQCIDAGAQIISMSLGGSGSSEAERQAFEDAYLGAGDYEGLTDGVLSIAAAGNGGSSWLSYPASYDSVMSVAAIDQNLQVATFSQHNSQVEVSAPGVGVMSTLPSDDYAAWDGTSMATPHVSGAAALIWSHHEQCSNLQIRAALQAGAADLGGSGRDSSYGHGLVSATASASLLADADGCATPAPSGVVAEPLSNGVPYPVGSGVRGDEFQFVVDLPPGASDLQIRMSGAGGDADLYVRHGAAPAPDIWDCRPYINGNSETCVEPLPHAGTWHVMVRAYTDFDGVSLQVDFVEPESNTVPVYFHPVADIPVYGTVSGTYDDLAYNDGDLQIIREAESPGKRSTRTSQAEHRWRISGVVPGASTTLQLVAAGEDKGEGDNFRFEISYDGGDSWSDLLTLPLGGALKTYSVALPATTQGDVLVRATDTDRTPRNQALERLWVDQLQIVTLLDTTGDVVPEAPSGFSASPGEAGIRLDWNDNSDNELGFEIHRATESGGAWGAMTLMTRTGQDAVSWVDDTALPGTHYRYQLAAFTATQASSPVYAEATTPDGILLEGVGEKRKGKIFVTLSWSPPGSVTIYRRVDGGPEVAFASDPAQGSTHEDDTGLKGAPVLQYRVCDLIAGVCSNTVTFTF